MDDREIRRFDSLVRVDTFGGTIAAENTPGSVAANNFAIVAAVVAELSGKRANQKRTANTSKEVLLDAARLDLQNIIRTAAVIGLSEPGFADNYPPLANQNEGTVVATANAFLKLLAAQPGDDAATQLAKSDLVAKFIAHDLSANFVTNLQGDIAAIAELNTQLEIKREAGVGDTAKVGPALKRGLDAVAVLNAIMHNRYGSQPDKLAEWLTASHVERDPKREKKTKPPTPPPTP